MLMLPDRRAVYHLLGIFLFIFAMGNEVALAEEFNLQVNTGHVGDVEQLAYDAMNRILFSAGEDGTVRLWKPDETVLLKKIRVSYLPVKMLALSPQNNLMAVLETNDLTIFRLSVWNWKEGKKLYTISLKHRPMFITFSKRGSYLAYSRPDWNSLVIIDSLSGHSLPYMQEAFGIVSFMVFSSSEETLLTYQPSGKLIYWHLKSGTIIKSVVTLPDLRQMRISADRSFAAAKKGDSVVLIDLLTGNVLDRRGLIGIEDIAISPGDNEIACVVKGSGGQTQLYRYAIIDKSLYNISISQENGLNTAIYGNNELFLGKTDGSLSFIGSDGIAHSIGENKLEKIYDIAFNSGKLAFITGNSIYTFESNFFTGENLGKDLMGNRESLSLKITRFGNPIGGKTQLAPLTENKLITWTDSSTEFPMAFIDMRNGSFTYSSGLFNAPLTYVGDGGRWVLTVEDTGECKLIDKSDESIYYSYSAPGMHKLIVVKNDNLIGAKSKLDVYDSSLLWINPITGETFPITDDSLYVYELAYDRFRDTLYSIGVERKNGILATVLKKRTGKTFDNSTVLERISGEEDVGASIAVDETDGSIYTSLGYGKVMVFRGTGRSDLEYNGEIARKLIYKKGKLFALNRDSSISVWNVETGRLLLDFYLMKDGEWLIITYRSGVLPMGYISSPLGEKYLSVVYGTNLFNNLLPRFRLKLKIRQLY